MTLETSDVSKVANKKTTNEQEIVARKGELDSRDGLVFSLVQKRSNGDFVDVRVVGFGRTKLRMTEE